MQTAAPVTGSKQDAPENHDNGESPPHESIRGMTPDRHDRHGSIDRDRVLRQLDKMLASGRITRQEAERLRSAGPEEFEAAVRAISERHMTERKDRV